jgi:hypothetical protein
MKLHNAATSTLIAWYLISPPIKGGSAELRAPLAKWDIESRYDSAAECRKAKTAEAEEIVSAQTGWSVSNNGAEKRAIIEAITAEKCVASDDPKLQKR